MKIIWRYVLSELFWPFVFGVVVCLLVLIMDTILDVMNLIISKGIPAGVVLEFFGLSLAWMVALAVPMGMLVGTIMSFGRLSADNEVIALRSCGIPLIKITVPALVLGFVLAAFLCWFNDRILPEANHRARLLMTDMTRKKPAWSLEENVFLDYFEGYHILVKKVDRKGSKISGITVFDYRNPKAPSTVTAKEGQLQFSADGSRLVMELYDGEIHEPDPTSKERYRRVGFKKQTLTIEGASAQLERSVSSQRGDREMPIRIMLEENRKNAEQIRQAKARIDALIRDDMERLLAHTISADTTHRLIKGASPKAATRASDILTKIEYETRTIQTYRRQINSMNVEINKKYSIPMACVVFVFLGTPLGVISRKGGMATSLGLSLFFFVVYWAFLIGGEEMADRMYIAGALAMWLPNVIIAIAGILLLILVERKTALETLIFRQRQISMRQHEDRR